MISQIRGNLISKEPFTLVIDAGGIGYEIFCTQAAYEHAPGIGNDYQVFTRFIVREDSQTLYGFSTQDERKLFDQIVSVSGIGPKTGLAIVSSLGTNALKEAIRTKDLIALTGIPGVGKKTAERLVVELRDKLLKEEVFTSEAGAPDSGNARIRQEALAALVALGYNRADAEKAIRTVIREQPAEAEKVERLIKAALKTV
ncbi:MAG: Holliday junction branch migration protein RuvA [Bacteroidota bacterium]|nr:Holliday junction branch migration protein RuvA [Bacteroidota bacterium]MDP4229236.1 Holliday junction branch migration protein RuvA [Bacteroidota bacterium]MDP4237046.1 Holliday junction branch migration protein RuvA [Bacteroidota bacterium]